MRSTSLWITVLLAGACSRDHKAAAPAPPPPPSAPAGPTALLAEGQAAPDFESQGHDGTQIKLSALKGHPVVVYFYPKDDTPG